MKRLSLLLTIVFVPLVAQEQLPMRGPGAERIEQFKKIRMMEVLRLDEETSLRFIARYNKHQEALRSIGTNRDSLIDELEVYRRRNASESDYEKIFKALTNLGHDAVRERERFLSDLKTILTTKQIAEYLTFERRFYQNLRETMREIQQERRRGMMR
jgi:hypothetical protein